ncbi:hypothetical protein DFH05DRAFT_1588223 [Lentinula detonsa]|uniref:Uncharacterized protein n=1 Tax=Lentinula detonsa TaxID=2804962 RepID=A0A9W8U0T6_9AGAR|nr:hypothetical protein DFH05DRAFT_1588223 [Lentinula detonsa]
MRIVNVTVCFGVAKERLAGKPEAEWQQLLDFCIMKAICLQGLLPKILDSNEWRELIAVATKNRLKSTTTDAFEQKHIPHEAAHIHKETISLLRKEYNLTLLTFDGGDTRGPYSVYTVHVTTADRKTYFCAAEYAQLKHSPRRSQTSQGANANAS